MDLTSYEDVQEYMKQLKELEQVKERERESKEEEKDIEKKEESKEEEKDLLQKKARLFLVGKLAHVLCIKEKLQLLLKEQEIWLFSHLEVNKSVFLG